MKNKELWERKKVKFKLITNEDAAFSISAIIGAFILVGVVDVLCFVGLDVVGKQALEIIRAVANVLAAVITGFLGLFIACLAIAGIPMLFFYVLHKVDWKKTVWVKREVKRRKKRKR